jgi:pyruvate,water dikinase
VEDATYIRWFSDLRIEDIDLVGGKNASLGEMISTLSSAGISVPDGFAITTPAYDLILEENRLEHLIRAELESLRKGEKALEEVGRTIRVDIRSKPLPPQLESEIIKAYEDLSRKYGEQHVSVAVRSSATAEDLPDASFAGQQDTFLNIHGVEQLLEAVRNCFASLYTDRAISYRADRGYDKTRVALSVGVQKMVLADRAGAGVMFTLDTETGFDQVVFITAAFGLGETVVQGVTNPDEYYVFKPLVGATGKLPIVRKILGPKEKSMIFATEHGVRTRLIDTRRGDRERYVLSDDEIIQLARWADLIEKHYSEKRGQTTPMDIEWAKDGESNQLFIVQARPETVHSTRRKSAFLTYHLKEQGDVLVEGRAVGESVAVGKVCRIERQEEMDSFEDGSILVTEMTDPNWGPIMKRSTGIITDLGGRTCHAAIVARELGIPAVVGTGTATEVLEDGSEVTLSSAEGEIGKVYAGALEFDVEEVAVDEIPSTRTGIMMNVANPAVAFRVCQIPNEGVGLARVEFVIANDIQAHPLALIHYNQLENPEDKEAIDRLVVGYPSRRDFFVENLAEGVATIASAFYPRDVIVRLSDFKSNEYASLIGGHQFEPREENPMIGLRGASRYYSDSFRPAFELECEALSRVRQRLGLTNVKIMIPFCRTPEEGAKVIDILEHNGLKRGREGLEVYVMCELPSNVILGREFAEIFDGFSIGSNDLTQLVLGVDRDSGLVAHVFDERHDAVKRAISTVIRHAKEAGRKVGICGQAPSDFPDFVTFLIEEGIDSISVNPDTALKVRQQVYKEETEKAKVN